MVVTTNYQQVGAFFQFWKPEFEIHFARGQQVSAGLFVLKVLGGNPFPQELFQFLQVACIPWLVAPFLALLHFLAPMITFPISVVHLPLPPSTKELVITFQIHSDKPGKSLHP